MYRDDLEALRARVASVEAALEAEQRGREAAEAAARAARARTEELRLALKRLDAKEPSFVRRHGLTVVALLLALAAVGAFIGQRVDRVRDRERIARLESESEGLRRDVAERGRVRHRLEQELARRPRHCLFGVDTGRPAADKSPVGYLIANTYPFARVVVDGKDTGLTTPITQRSKIALSPGSHRVTFVVDAQRFDVNVRVTAGEIIRVVKRLPVAAID
jgi:hypothetical protein